MWVKFFRPAPLRLHYRHCRFLYQFAPLHANTALAFLQSNGRVPSWSQQHAPVFSSLGDNLEALMFSSSISPFTCTISIPFSPIIILTLNLILTVDH